MDLRRTIVVPVTIALLGLALPPAHAATTATPKELVQVVATAGLTFEGQSVPIPHPRAITYNSTDDKLVVTDANLLNGDLALFNNVNVWELTRQIEVTDTWNISTMQKDASGNLVENPGGFSDGPAGVAYNPADGGHLYFLNAHGGWYIKEVMFGPNGEFGDADDVRLPQFRVGKLTNDSEDLAFAMTPDLRPGMSGLQPTLFVAAGHESDTPNTGNQVFILQPGPNGIFDGPPTGPNDPANLIEGGDDVMTQFATGPLDQIDLEAVAYFEPPWADEPHLFITSRYKFDRVDPPRSDPFVTEVTLDGTFVNEYPLRTNTGGRIKGLRPSGIVIAPSSSTPGAYSMYITDRGPGVFSDPSSNAGRIFEWRISDPILVTNPGPRSSLEGDAVSLAITATDPKGDPITYGASGLPTGLSVDAGTGQISGTVAAGAAAGSPYTVTVTASNANGIGSETFTWLVTDPSAPPPPTVLELEMAIGSDDAEEASSGAVDATSSDLELVSEGGDLQTVGLRFPGTGVPAGVTITNAWIGFQVDEVSDVATDLTIHAQAADNAATFSAAANNISNRARTGASVGWTPPAWPTLGDAGADQRTPDLAPLVQEVVDRPGWSGGALAFIITGTGKRVAESFEGGLGLTPTLHLEYSTVGSPVVDAPPVVSNPGDQSSSEDDVVSLQIAASDPDGDILTYSASNLPTGLSIDASTGLISGTVAAGAAGASPYAVAVTADDGTTSVMEPFLWTIQPPEPANSAPVLTNPGEQSSIEGGVVSLTVSAVDVDGDPIVYGATGLPPGLSIDPPTGLISGTVEAGAAVGSPYTVTVDASDGSLNDVEVFTWTVDTAAPTTLTIPVAARSDDAEEAAGGAIDLKSSDLELVKVASGLQTVGVRFTGVSVPAGATILGASIQFTVDEATTRQASLTIRGQAADNPPTFQAVSGNVSSRPTTSAGVGWMPAPWSTVGQAGPDQRTPDLAPVVQEIVDRAGWAPGNAMVFVITGSGNRTAESWDGTAAPILRIEYLGEGGPVNNPPVVTDVGPRSDNEGGIVSLQIVASDPDGDPLIYSATGLPPGLTIDASTGLISGTVNAGAAAASPYTAEVTVWDASLSGTTSFSWTISIGPGPER